MIAIATTATTIAAFDKSKPVSMTNLLRNKIKILYFN
ncbi:uncharacterized protein METZ01_LOCUS150864 [marine metagenome]|uniref:Uncharacterized protein n=1 Tax=marine metagenome TaxID=408172 RepID=A0A382A939_9ZZZZ